MPNRPPHLQKTPTFSCGSLMTLLLGADPASPLRSESVTRSPQRPPGLSATLESVSSPSLGVYRCASGVQDRTPPRPPSEAAGYGRGNSRMAGES